MNRRDFLTLTTTTSAAALLSQLGFAASGPDAWYQAATVIDSLSSPFTDNDKLPTADAVAEVARSGITAINFTVSDATFEGTIQNLAYVDALIERYPTVFMLVRVTSDIARAKREKKIGIIPGFQHAGFLEENPDRIEMFRRLGVRIMQLTYNNRGLFGDGCLEPGNAGLSKAGLAAARRMNELGVAVDVSHCGYHTTSDAIENSAVPVLVTHSGCAAVYAHPRNKPDNILRALADRGGYFGVYFMPYLVASPIVPTREHVLDHLVHAINTCGADHVGIGSDGPIQKIVLTAEQKASFEADIARRKQLGIGAPGEDRYPYVADLSGPDRLSIIASELQKRGQPAAVAEKILGANFKRVLGEIWGAA